MQRIKNFLRDESGIETLEYAFVAAAIVVLAALAYTTSLATAIKTKIEGLL